MWLWMIFTTVFGANERDWTVDLVLTMDALYRLSYIGLWNFSPIRRPVFSRAWSHPDIKPDYSLVCSAFLGIQGRPVLYHGCALPTELCWLLFGAPQSIKSRQINPQFYCQIMWKPLYSWALTSVGRSRQTKRSLRVLADWKEKSLFLSTASFGGIKETS